MNISALKDLGWGSLVIWECETRSSAAAVKERIQSFLI